MALVQPAVLTRNNLTAPELQPMSRGARLKAAVELTMLQCSYQQYICPQPCHAVEGESALSAIAVSLSHACGVGVLSLQAT